MEIIDKMKSHASKRVVLLGIGGIGKTQLALRFYRLAEESLGFMAMIWIDASSPVSAIQSYIHIADKISGGRRASTDDEELVSYVQKNLRSWKKPWLLIFDNFDSPKAFQCRDIIYYVPSGTNGSILFTSRYRDAARLGHYIDFLVMSKE